MTRSGIANCEQTMGTITKLKTQQKQTKAKKQKTKKIAMF